MVLIVVIVVFLACWGTSQRWPMPRTWATIADRYVINIALPAVIIAKVSQVELTQESAVPVVAAWACMASCAVLVFVIGRRRAWPQSVIGALLMVAVLGNTSFLGIGVVRSLLGEDHVAAAITYDQLGTFLALATYGSWIAGTFGAAERGWRPALRRLFRFVPFLALLLSVALRSVEIPGSVLSVLDGVGLTVAPVAMGVLGTRFRLRLAHHVRGPAITGLIVKMALVPVALLLVAASIGQHNDLEWSSAVLQSAAPPMVTAGVVAVAAGLDEDLVSFMVGVGTLVSFLSLPLLSLAL